MAIDPNTGYMYEEEARPRYESVFTNRGMEGEAAVDITAGDTAAANRFVRPVVQIPAAPVTVATPPPVALNMPDSNPSTDVEDALRAARSGMLLGGARIYNPATDAIPETSGAPTGPAHEKYADMRGQFANHLVEAIRQSFGTRIGSPPMLDLSRAELRAEDEFKRTYAREAQMNAGYYPSSLRPAYEAILARHQNIIQREYEAENGHYGQAVEAFKHGMTAFDTQYAPSTLSPGAARSIPGGGAIESTVAPYTPTISDAGGITTAGKIIPPIKPVPMVDSARMLIPSSNSPDVIGAPTERIIGAQTNKPLNATEIKTRKENIEAKYNDIALQNIALAEVEYQKLLKDNKPIPKGLMTFHEAALTIDNQAQMGNKTLKQQLELGGSSGVFLRPEQRDAKQNDMITAGLLSRGTPTPSPIPSNLATKSPVASAVKYTPKIGPDGKTIWVDQNGKEVKQPPPAL